MRKRALERVRQTTKRKDKEEGTETGPAKKKSRKSTGEAVECLKERDSTEIQLGERKLEMRKKEQESMSQRERERGMSSKIKCFLLCSNSKTDSSR